MIRLRSLCLLALTIACAAPAHADLYNYYPVYRQAGNTRSTHYRPRNVASGSHSARTYSWQGVGLAPRYSAGPAPVVWSNYAPCRDSAVYSNYAPLRP